MNVNKYVFKLGIELRPQGVKSTRTNWRIGWITPGWFEEKGQIHPTLQNRPSAKKLARQWILLILSPKKQRRPLPFLLYLSFFYVSTCPSWSLAGQGSSAVGDIRAEQSLNKDTLNWLKGQCQDNLYNYFFDNQLNRVLLFNTARTFLLNILTKQKRIEVSWLSHSANTVCDDNNNNNNNNNNNKKILGTKVFSRMRVNCGALL